MTGAPKAENAPKVRPYPIETWTRLSREQAFAASTFARALPSNLARAAEIVDRALGLVFGIQVDHVEFHEPTRRTGVDDVIVAAYFRSRRRRARAVLRLEPALAHWIVDRTLGSNAAHAVPNTVALSDVERGVLAYALSAALAEAVSDWSLCGVTTTPTAALDSLDHGRFVRANLTIDAGPRRYWSQLYVGGGVDATPEVRQSRNLEPVRLTWVVDQGRAWLTADQLRTLQVGDVVIPDEWWRRAQLHALGDHSAVLYLSTELPFEVVAIDHPSTCPPQKRSQMSKPANDPKDSTRDFFPTNAPVDLAVEIARFRLPLGEVRDLRVGEVLQTGSQTSTQVTLRAGEHPIATGELVDIEGEVGVRIVELLRE